MSDWAADSAAQMMEKHCQCRGERVVALDGIGLERDLALKLRIAYAAGMAKAQIDQRNQDDIKKVISE